MVTALKPIAMAVALIAAIEGAAYISAPPRIYSSNFLELAYARRENQTKVQQEIKLDLVAQLKPAILQVGDSSGFHGPEPFTVQKYIGAPYVILSCCGDMGYSGHRYIAEAALARAPPVKMLVFYVSPFSLPGGFGDLGPEFRDAYQRAFLGPWHYLDPPSMAYRMSVTNFLYYGKWSRSPDANPHNHGNKTEAQLRQWFTDSHGWTPRPPELSASLPAAPTGPCQWRSGYSKWLEPGGKDGTVPVTTLYSELSAVAQLARQYSVKLAIVFNPVSCERDADVMAIEGELARFRKINPEVFVTPFITTWPASDFVDPWHLTEPGSYKIAHKLGPILRQAIDARYIMRRRN